MVRFTANSVRLVVSFFLIMILGCGIGYFVSKAQFIRSVTQSGQLLALCSDVPCDHFNARMPAIESKIAQRSDQRVYLFIGDSHVERANLPSICGRLPINAGIGWATVNTFMRSAALLAERAKPDFILISLGTNDALRDQLSGFRERFSALLTSLEKWPVVLVPLPPSKSVRSFQSFNEVILSMPVASAKPLEKVSSPDGVHLSNDSYVHWKSTISAAAETSVCRQRSSM